MGYGRMSKQSDLFDKLMSLPVVSVLKSYCVKYKEVLAYVLFGGLAFVVSIASYVFFNIMLSINELIANVLSWVITVLFAFVTNRIWVFHTTVDSFCGFVRQMMSFYGGRLVTLLVEEIILLVFITILQVASIPVKVVAQVIVMVMNYFISKKIVFRKRE